MMKNRLLELDIPPDHIEVIPDEQEATTRALEMAAPNDLLLILGDNIKRTWKQIIYFNSGAKIVETPSKAPTTMDLPDVGDFSLSSDVEIISDERGVRIAREEGD